MKTSEAKILAKSAKSNTPFFHKLSKQSFFSTNSVEPSFFSIRSNNHSTIQPKLAIGQPNDQYEQEADAMADKVVQRLSEMNVAPQSTKTEMIQAKSIGQTPSITPILQTKCAACEKEERLQMKEEEEMEPLEDKLQRMPIFESNAFPPDEEAVQRKCAECEKEEKIQKKENSYSGTTASPSIENSLASSKGSGNPLPADTREQMESSFGADFSKVRIHNDTSSVQMNKDLNAQAFTHGSDIYFNSGKYNPGTSFGKHLLAHELTHTIQQGTVEPSKKIEKKSIQKKPIGEEVQDKLREANATLTTEAPMPGAAPRGAIDVGQDPLGFDRMGFADLYSAGSISGFRGIAIDDITSGKNAGKKKYVYANISQSDIDKAKGPKNTLPVLSGGTGQYARFIVDAATSTHFSGHNAVTGNFPATIQIGEIKGKDTLLDNPGFAPEQLKMYRNGLNRFIASAKRDFGSHLVKPSFSELTGLIIPQGMKYDEFEDEHKKESEGILKVQGSKRVWLGEVGQTGIYLWARLPHPYNLPEEVSKEEHLAITKLRQDVLEEFNKIKQNKPQGTLVSKKELTDDQRINKETDPQAIKNDNNSIGVKPGAGIHGMIQRKTDWKTARSNFQTSLSSWKKTYGNKFLRNEQVEKFLEEKVEFDQLLKKRGGTTGKINKHTNAYKKIEFWAGPKGLLIGNLRLLLGEKFDALAEKIEGLKERTNNAKTKARLLKTPTFSKGWMAKIVHLLLKGFKIGFEEFIDYSFQVFAGCISGVIEKFEEEMRQKLVEGFVDEELENALEELRKELEALIASIQEKYEAEIAEFEALLDLMQDAAYYTSIITTAVNLIRLGVQIVSCVSPPLLGCLWGLVANIGIEVALNLVVGTEWFENNFMKPLVRDMMDKYLKRSLLKFLNEVFELVGLADYVVGVEACKPSSGDMKSLRHDSGKGIIIRPDMYRAHTRKWEAKHRTELMNEVVAASHGTATQEDIERFLEIVQKENMSSEEFNKIVSGSKTSDESFDFKKISDQVPGLGSAKEEGGEKVKVIDGEKSPMKGGPGGGKAGTIRVYNPSVDHTKGANTTIILLCVSNAGESVLLTNVKVKVEHRYYFNSEKGIRLSGRDGSDSMQIVYEVTHSKGYTVTFSDSEGVIPFGKKLLGYVDLGK